MNQNDNDFQQWADEDVDNVDFDELESKLESELEEQMSDLKELEKDREKIGNPDTIGKTVMNVVWEQFINQAGIIAGEDFIKENRGLTLDLRDEAHIQTTDNFAEGKIATHNTHIDYQQRYDDWQNNFARNEDGSIMTNPRSGENVLRRENRKKYPNDENYNTNYNARAYLNGEPGSASMHNDHTISAAEIIRDPEANAHLSRDEQHEFATGDKNYKPLDSAANESKGDKKMVDWLDSERYGQKPAERFNIDEVELRERDRVAREEYAKQKKEGEQRSIEAGKQSQKEEAFRIGGKALRAFVMNLLASLIKDIIRKLIIWFRSGNRKLSSFIDSVKQAIRSFIIELKQHLLTAGNTLATTIATAIFGPVIGMIKKAWIFLKQGYNTVKQAVKFLKDPANKEMPFSLKMMQVGKIVIVGLTAGGTLILSEVIEKGLMTMPVFAFEIPLLGSLASLLGMFFGALVSGLIGALALNLIDRLIAKKLKKINDGQQITKRNKILSTQSTLIKVVKEDVEAIRAESSYKIKNRHNEASSIMRSSIEEIQANSAAINNPLAENAIIVDEEPQKFENEDAFNDLFSNIEDISDKK